MPPPLDKARAQRLERLQAEVDGLLEHPDAALETLMLELQIGELHPESWEGLHAAAARDGKEADLAKAYDKVTADRRLRQLMPEQRASVLMHAADFSRGILGDAVAAERTLWSILEATPDHAGAFARLERGFNATRDRVRLGELYALVAVKPPKPPIELAQAACNVISVLPSHSPLPDEACKKLLVLLPVNQSLLEVLEAHCRKTGRFALTCELLEESLTSDLVSEAEVLERRRRLIDLYLGEAKDPEKAISHVEALLEQDPSDTQARSAADRLLRVPQVASRAAAAQLAARRSLRERT
jgi:tetratricopeptide (TPR) repeat protein